MKLKNFTLDHEQKNPLKKYPTQIKSLFESEDETKNELKHSQEKLANFQELLYAQNEWAVLIVLQGMDTAGKDSLIEHVMKSVNPQGCDVTSFKRPTHLELNHDFLWRVHAHLPERRKIGVFNRSYYEDIIVPLVHPEVLKSSQLPKQILNSKKLLSDRCHDIVNFEKYLARQGIIVIKIFLHLSKNEQKNRLLRRLEIPEKNWKFDPNDMTERSFWSEYQRAYNFCLQKTSHEKAPWYVIPADDKNTARLIASQLIVSRMKELNLAFPKTSAENQKQLKQYEKILKRK